jgi:hypothetical protein
MLDIAKSPKANVMPCLTYRDAPAAVEFLCRAFGFEKKMVVPGDKNTIAHAELTLGNAMVMLGSTKDIDYGRLVKPPRDVGVSTQSTYLGGDGRRCAPRPRQGGGRRDRHRSGHAGLRRPRLHLPRSGGTHLDLRHL